MRSVRFEITRVLLTVLGAVLLVGIGLRLLRSGVPVAQVVGMIILLLLALAIGSSLRKFRRKG